VLVVGIPAPGLAAALAAPGHPFAQLLASMKLLSATPLNSLDATWSPLGQEMVLGAGAGAPPPTNASAAGGHAAAAVDVDTSRPFAFRVSGVQVGVGRLRRAFSAKPYLFGLNRD
jgi:hypothetical protein